MVTPLTVTPAWLALWRKATAEGVGIRDAKAAASRALGISGKAFARCHIASGTVTVPVEGGASLLKRNGAEPILSEHGKWRREHIGAWHATYSRTPFFIHLMPEIEQVYDSSQGITLEEFNSRLLDVALGWLDFSALGHDAVDLNPFRVEFSRKIRGGLSIFDLLFRIGPDALFAVTPHINL